MEERKVEMVLVKSTKGTYVYGTNEEGGGTICRQVYLDKAALPSPPPSKITLAVIFAAALVAGCAAPQPYDRQFSTLETIDSDGVQRSHAWLIGPTKAQAADFEARRKARD